MSTWRVYLRDGTSATVEADEVVLESGVRFVNNHIEGAGLAERYVDVLVVAPGIWARVEAADANLQWTPASAPPARVPSRF